MSSILIEIEAAEATRFGVHERLVPRNAQFARVSGAIVLKGASRQLHDVLMLDRPKVNRVGRLNVLHDWRRLSQVLDSSACFKIFKLGSPLKHTPRSAENLAC